MLRRPSRLPTDVNLCSVFPPAIRAHRVLGGTITREQPEGSERRLVIIIAIVIWIGGHVAVDVLTKWELGAFIVVVVTVCGGDEVLTVIVREKAHLKRVASYNESLEGTAC